jgi:hypothetical protein
MPNTVRRSRLSVCCLGGTLLGMIVDANHRWQLQTRYSFILICLDGASIPNLLPSGARVLKNKQISMF